jgi:hypothetical protein
LPRPARKAVSAALIARVGRSTPAPWNNRVGGLGRRYEGEEALKLREAVQALCCHATAEEWAR